jgi:hypothetical protein
LNADTDINWSHPIPKEAREGSERDPDAGDRSSRGVTASVEPAEPSRRAAETTEPSRRAAETTEPSRREDPPRRRSAETNPEDDFGGTGGSTERKTPEERRVAIAPITRAPAPTQSKPITQQWWFWTVIGVGTVGIATGVVIAIMRSQPPTSYDVFVQVNPPN